MKGLIWTLILLDVKQLYTTVCAGLKFFINYYFKKSIQKINKKIIDINFCFSKISKTYKKNKPTSYIF